MIARFLTPPFLVALLCHAPSLALAQDSITVLVDLSDGAYGSLGPHALGRQLGPSRDTLAAVKVAKGQLLRYHFTSRPGWHAPILELMGHGLVPPDSSIVPQEPLVLVVAAKRIPKLVPEARRWHALYLQALRSSTPGPLYQQMLCETVKILEGLGQDSAMLVTDWAGELAEAAIADTHAKARLDSLLGGKTYDLTCRPPH